MDSKYEEMILFLHGNLDLIPRDIPKLSAAAAQDKIPGRLVNPVAVSYTHLTLPTIYAV